MRPPRPPRRRRSQEGAGTALVIGFLVSIPLGLYKGWVIHLLWRWFVVPLGVDPIGVAHAWGLSLLVGLMTVQRDSERAETPLEGLFQVVFLSLMLSTLALAFGAVLS